METTSEYEIDMDKIYAVGFSTGGLFLTQAIIDLNDMFSAAVNVMGGIVY